MNWKGQNVQNLAHAEHVLVCKDGSAPQHFSRVRLRVGVCGISQYRPAMGGKLFFCALKRQIAG